MFPSPENGVSFKQKRSFSYKILQGGILFPSPENGVSFKLVKGSKEWLDFFQFPSPENGVSFKLISDCKVAAKEVKFPSPENGVSFKHNKLRNSSVLNSHSFRPLKTGLVSNPINHTIIRHHFLSFRPLKTGLVSN